ncbi:glycosyltransferase family 4 protein [Candidatus Entotheonella palauensis]|nr:glycosyltransferase family 4 protein [Candidatus Entotheonella palauensis]
MHIAFVIYGSLDEVSGGFLYDRQLVESLQQHGHRVTIVALPWRSYLRSLSDNLSRGLLRTFRNHSFDLILQDELVHPSFFRMNRRLRQTVRLPMVSLIHLLRSSERAPVWQRHFYHWIERHYLGSIDGFIYVNRHIEARVHNMLHTHPPGVIANPAGDHLSAGLTPEQIRHRAQRPGPLKIVFVGNLTPLKGLHLVLQALHHLPAATWRLTVIGSPDRDVPYVRRIRQQIADAGWQENISMLGMLSNAEVGSYLAHSDVFAVPSNPESYSIAYLEAMNHGLPIIAHGQSDSADLVEHGISGFCIQPGDSHGFAEHLRTLAQNRHGLAQMSLAAQKRFMSLPSWAQSMNRAVRFLEEVVAVHRGDPKETT